MAVVLVKIEGPELEFLVQLSKEKRGMDVDRIARLMFLRGLRLTKAKTGNSKPMSPWQQQREELKGLIEAHWKDLDDAAIGRLMNPEFPRTSVQNLRIQMGLFRSRGKKRSGVSRELIDPAEFEEMVVRGGYTMTEYLANKRIMISRERIRQLAQDMGLKHSPEDRAPEWRFNRKVRLLGNPNFGDREWLVQKLADRQSITGVAAELGISDADLLFLIRAHQISHPYLRKHGAATVDLVCTHCGASFKRLQRWVDRRTRVSRSPQEYFCGPVCAGSHNYVRHRRRKNAESIIPTSGSAGEVKQMEKVDV